MTDEKQKFRLPWTHTLEEKAARAEVEQRRAAIEERAKRDLEAAKARQENDSIALKEGGLPSLTQERLRKFGTSEEDCSAFTSNLSAQELRLLTGDGYRSLGIVIGTCVYILQKPDDTRRQTGEIGMISAAYDRAVELAVTRMKQELKAIRAHGAIAVKLETTFAPEDDILHVRLIGTAIANSEPPPNDPWTCHLSGQEWWALRRAGYVPANIVWGYCAWYIEGSQFETWNGQTYVREKVQGDVSAWTTALLSAYRTTVAKTKTMGIACESAGIVGLHTWRQLDKFRYAYANVTADNRERALYHTEDTKADPWSAGSYHDLLVGTVATAVREDAKVPQTIESSIEMLSLRDGRFLPITKRADVYE